MLLLALGASAALAACDRGAAPGASSGSFNSIDLTGASYAQDLRLTDHNGQERSLADFRGKVVVVFFGFTQCPDVCPSAMAELAQAKQALGPDGERVQGLFVTVDPERDTPELLKAYMTNFDPSFLALRGTPEQTAAVAKDFKVYYKKVPGKSEGSYTMDHTAGIYVYDTSGRLRLYGRHNMGPQALAADLRQLLSA
ncbi:SCO family protein [Caldimonas tepidiphila]|uniref:SCO family protein n=1 Tax=Caldimonas tepidiphila TaxID=2315841 RepID=UPI001F0BC8FB|nr:SCO family protein [Caldimonas tepidiphila]